jgi:hypothetical protein
MSFSCSLKFINLLDNHFSSTSNLQTEVKISLYNFIVFVRVKQHIKAGLYLF